jgi:competence CoiA-like predicted nuclease
MAAFNVPYALNETHNLVTPEMATKEEKYVCPACQSPLILRHSSS